MISQLPDNALKRLQSELRVCKQNPSPNCRAEPVDETKDMINWLGTIIGPDETPYAGGVFSLKITFPINYPYSPPNILFTTQIYHPNIDCQGQISVNILQDQWSPALSLDRILLSISSLLSDPNPHDPLALDVAQIYREDQDLFTKIATEWTQKFAT